MKYAPAMKLSWPQIALLALAGAIAALVVGVQALQSRAADAPCRMREFEGSQFIVCVYDAQRDELRLASRASGGSYLRGFTALADELGREARRVRFAMNAGMYNDAGAPIGLYIADGEQQHVLRLTDGPGNFHMKPNGVFWLDAAGTPHVTPSEAYAAAPPPARWATQSGPMLVIDGALHPRIQHDGPSRNVRNGVGVSDGRHAYFVISAGFVSFGRFARFFRDELGCRNALFLDGAVSSLWAPSLSRRDDDHAIGPMVVVLR